MGKDGEVVGEGGTQLRGEGEEGGEGWIGEEGGRRNSCLTCIKGGGALNNTYVK